MVDEETELVEAARRGSQEAFARILHLHQAAVRAFLSRYVQNDDVVDDLAQETFLTAYRSLPSFKGESLLRTWLLGIARHRALRHLRDLERRECHEADVIQTTLASWLAKSLDDDSSRLTRHDQERSALEQCLSQLPQDRAELVYEFYHEGRGAVDIARARGKKDSAVWVSLMRIRNALRRCVQLRLKAAGIV